MKRLIHLFLVSLIACVFLVGSIGVFAQEKVDLDSLFMQGVNRYYEKDYAEALSIFKGIQGINPSFRTSQVRRYIRVSETRLGKLGVKEQFIKGVHSEKEIEVSTEG